MKTETKNIWSSTSARILGAFLLLAPCAALTACGGEEATPNGGSTTAVCGNGEIESGEVCDGAAMPADAPDGATCKADCSGWETETPTSECGNGVIEDGEACDGEAMPADAPAGASCLDTCQLKVPECGNGEIEAGEECDGEAMPEGAEPGSTCLDTCQIKAPTCGNGTLDTDAGEECDYSESGDHLLPGGIAQGAECLANCSLKVCGNDRIDGDEACDGTAFPEGTTAGAVCIEACTVIDSCPDNADKNDPTPVCGCGELADDLDTDGDGQADCIDACENDPYIATATNETGCDCGYTKVDGTCYANIVTAQDFMAKAGQELAILKDDINLGTALTIEGGKAKWTPLNTATVVLLGEGYTVTASDPNGAEGNRLTLVCEAEYCGLFERIGANGKPVTLSGLTVDLDMETSLGSAKSGNAGLLAGELDGKSTLSGVHAKGKLTVASADYAGGLVGSVGSTETILDSSAQVTLDVTGAEAVGGLVGYLGGTLYNAWAEGNVSLKSNGKFSLGGLVGLLDGHVANAYAIGDVTASLETNAGSSSDAGDAGGLIGQTTSGSDAVNAYALGKVTGRPNATGAVGASIDTVGGTIGDMQGEAKLLYWWAGSGSNCIGSDPASTVCGDPFEVVNTSVGTIGWYGANENTTTLLGALVGNLGTEAFPCAWEDRNGDNENDTCVVADGGPAYRIWVHLNGESPDTVTLTDSAGVDHVLRPVRLFGLP